MGSNIGTIDRMARVLIGAALLAAMFFGTIGHWGWIGVVPLLTAFIGFCPLYRVAGLST